MIATSTKHTFFMDKKIEKQNNNETNVTQKSCDIVKLYEVP